MIIIKHRKSADVVLLRVDAAELDDRDLTGTYLLGAGMAGLSVRRARLCEANLRNADLRAANLAGADLSGAVLRNADLRDADLSNTVLVDADLGGASLCRANLCGANLSGAQLFETDLSDVRCDAQTIWPVGDAWGPMAQPVASVEMSAKSRELAAGRAVVQRWALAQQRTGLSDRGGPAARGWIAGFGAAALALALLIVALADRGLRTARLPGPALRVAVRAPLSKPETSSVQPAPMKRIDRVPVPHPSIVRQPSPQSTPPLVQARTAPVRVERGGSERPVRLARQAAPIWHSGEVPPSSGGSARTRAPHRLVVLNSSPSRNRRPAVSAPAPLGETPMSVESPAVEPAITAVTPATPVVTPPLKKTASRFEPRPRKIAEAWGNRDFHYGSGYDIYTMHLGSRPR